METMTQAHQKASAPAGVLPQASAAEQTEADALQAARALAAALAETPQYKAFDQASLDFRRDEDAQTAIRAFQEKRGALEWRLQMGLINVVERQELQRLQQAMLERPTVRAYMNAQQRFAHVCYEVSELVSELIGLSFAAACGPGCSCH